MTSARLRPAPAFIDTAVYYAFAAPRDHDHQEAVIIFRQLGQRRFPLYTTNLIIAETHVLLKSRLAAYISKQHALDTARHFIESIYQSAVRIEPVTPDDERTALLLLAAYADQDFSFTDATSFVVMKRLRIPYAFSFDGDYVTAGFTDVRHVLG